MGSSAFTKPQRSAERRANTKYNQRQKQQSNRNYNFSSKDSEKFDILMNYYDKTCKYVKFILKKQKKIAYKIIEK